MTLPRIVAFFWACHDQHKQLNACLTLKKCCTSSSLRSLCLGASSMLDAWRLANFIHSSSSP